MDARHDRPLERQAEPGTTRHRLAFLQILALAAVIGLLASAMLVLQARLRPRPAARVVFPSSTSAPIHRCTRGASPRLQVLDRRPTETLLRIVDASAGPLTVTVTDQLGNTSVLTVSP